TAIRGDVLRVLKKLAGAGFDLILADPPYLHALVQATIDRTAEFGVLGSDGWFVAEHHKQEVPTSPSGWETVKQGTYGETWVSVFRRIV
ncbi:RsmD family RNA methyltransferase, partial [candidate division WOR-3 bacterium]|nr:RsmD family RNA methyltransferase [candidate division WOR-3 bacterium]